MNNKVHCRYATAKDRWH